MILPVTRLHWLLFWSVLFCPHIFSATATAFSTMSHARMKTMADKGDKSAALALQLADNYDSCSLRS